MPEVRITISAEVEAALSDVLHQLYEHSGHLGEGHDAHRIRTWV